MTFRVTHTTAYTYESQVSASFGEAHLLPREMPGQRVHSAELVIDPQPEESAEHTDYFGNRTSYFALRSPHRTLTVTATSVVEVTGRGTSGQLLADQPWEAVRDALAAAERADGTPPDPETLAATSYALASPQVGRSMAAAAYAVPSFRPGRPVLEAVEHLSHRINTDFSFRPGATAVGTPVEQVLSRRAGVCQDFAHLTIAACRSMGLAARYVSGYLETDPPPGRPKLQGADVSHAWASVFIPRAGWVDIDPTNDQLVSDRYVTVGWGRDYGDVAPLKGVIFTDGETRGLKVSVDVRRLPPAGAMVQQQTAAAPAQPGAPRQTQQQQQQQRIQPSTGEGW